MTRDLTELRLLISPDELRTGVAWLAAAVRKPAGDEAAFTAARKAGLDLVQRSADDPISTGMDLFHEKVYAGHPYAHDVAGTPAGLQALTREDVAAYLARQVRPSQVVLAVAGDVAAADVIKLCRDLLADWKVAAKPGDQGPQRESGGTSSATSGARAGEFVRSLVGSQSRVIVGVPGVSVHDPAFDTIRLLGSALTLQGFEEMVFRRRAAFSVTAIPEGFRDGGALALEVVTSPKRRDEAVFDLQQMMRHLALEELPPGEIESLARMQAGRETLTAQGVQGLASTLAYREASGLGASSYRSAFAPTALPTPAQLHEAAERILRPDSWIVIKVGPGAE